GEVVGEPLRVAEAPVHGHHHAPLTAHVPRRAAVSEHRAHRHVNAIASSKARRLAALDPTRPVRRAHHGIFAFETRRPALVWRARTSAMRASISARVRSSCSTTRLRKALIHFW